MSRRLDDPRHIAWLVLGLSLSVLALGAVLYGRLPMAAGGGMGVRIAPTADGCPRARLLLACSRYLAAGWGCAVHDDGVPVAALTQEIAALAPSDALRGAVAVVGGERKVLVRADSCGASDPTLEHEIAHLLGLPDGGPTGSVTASPWDRTGLRIPERR